MLALLRLSCHDPDVFLKFKGLIIEKSAYPYAASNLQLDVRVDMERVADAYFPLNPSKDVSFEIARVFMATRDYERAV